MACRMPAKLVRRGGEPGFLLVSARDYYPARLEPNPPDDRYYGIRTSASPGVIACRRMPVMCSNRPQVDLDLDDTERRLGERSPWFPPVIQRECCRSTSPWPSSRKAHCERSLRALARSLAEVLVDLGLRPSRGPVRSDRTYLIAAEAP